MLLRVVVCSGTGGDVEMIEMHQPGKKLKRVLVNLHSRCRKCGKPKISLHPNLAESICKQLAMAMEYLHMQGIVHRDLKPGNILIKEEFDIDAPPERVSVQICDFGIGMLNGDSYSVLSSGTPGYMPPEAYALGLLNNTPNKKSNKRKKGKKSHGKTQQQHEIRSQHEHKKSIKLAQQHSQMLVKLYFDEEPTASELAAVRSMKFISVSEAFDQGGDVMVALREELLQRQSSYIKKHHSSVGLNNTLSTSLSLSRTLSTEFDVPRPGVIYSPGIFGIAVRKLPEVSLAKESVSVLRNGCPIEVLGECSALDQPSEHMLKIRPQNPTGKESWAKGYVRRKFVTYTEKEVVSESKKAIGTAWGVQPFLASWDVFSYAMLVMEIFTLRLPTCRPSPLAR